MKEKLDASTSSSRNINGSRKWESWKALNKSCFWMGLKYEIGREKGLVFIYFFFGFWEMEKWREGKRERKIKWRGGEGIVMSPFVYC